MAVQVVRELTEKEINIVNSALYNFENSLRNFKRDSNIAFSLTVFINACVDRNSFQPNIYSALVYYAQARASASILAGLLERRDGALLFNQGVRCAQTILRDSLLLNVDFFSCS